MTVVQPEKDWRVYRGHVFNLPQRAATGVIRVMPVAQARLQALDQAAARVIVDALPPGLTADDPADGMEERLVRRLAHWTSEVQRQARIPVATRSHARRLPPRSGSQTARFEVALPVASPQAFALAFQSVQDLINQVAGAAGESPLPDGHLEAQFEQLVERLKRHALYGFNPVHILNAAYRQGYPVRQGPSGLIQIGIGARTRTLQSSATDETSAIGMGLAQDKWVTAQLLRSIGLPAAEHVWVHSEEEAVAAARRFGFPVVVKPADLDQGHGVAANLRTEENVRAAFAAARKLSKRILLERHFHGFGHRLTIHHGELVTALRRIPGGVLGDGVHSIRALLDLRTQDPNVRKNVNYGRVALDGEALAMLAECGMTPDSVPPAGEFVMMRRRDNISAGGTSEPVAASAIHPDNILLAKRAARALLLDLAGVDLLIPDISVSWKSSGALVCEVNARPQFGPGPDGSNFDRVLQRLMHDGSRIPVRLYLVPEISAACLARASALASQLGLRAVASQHGVSIDGNGQTTAFTSNYDAALAALTDGDVESLLMVMTPKEVAKWGLPIDRVDAVHAPRSGPWDEASRQALQMALHVAGFHATQLILEEPQ